MPCCIEPVGGEIDQKTHGDVQRTEREIQMGLRLVVVTVVVTELTTMVMAVVAAVVLVLLPFLLLEDIVVALVVVRVDGSQISLYV